MFLYQAQIPQNVPSGIRYESMHSISRPQFLTQYGRVEEQPHEKLGEEDSAFCYLSVASRSAGRALRRRSFWTTRCLHHSTPACTSRDQHFIFFSLVYSGDETKTKTNKTLRPSLTHLCCMFILYIVSIYFILFAYTCSEVNIYYVYL